MWIQSDFQQYRFLLGYAFHQPSFCPNVSWNDNATTLLTTSNIGDEIKNLFLDQNNTLYLVQEEPGAILIFYQGQTVPAHNLTSNLNKSIAVFVADNGDIYVDNGAKKGRVERWTNYWNPTPVMFVPTSCRGLFIDNNNSLYCSLKDQELVLIKYLNDNANTTRVVAGNGTCGPALNTLCDPYGMFVTENFNLYIADRNNGRVMLFQLGQINGTAVAGNGSSVYLPLLKPTNVFVDADGYLYIADEGYHSIFRVRNNYYRCIAGCSGSSGSQAHQLDNPFQMAFDSTGALIVLDEDNERIQKFDILMNSCRK